MKHRKHSKKFRAIIIKKQTISIFVLCVTFGIIMGSVFFFSRSISKAEQNNSYAEEIYKSALEDGLPTVQKKNDKNLSEIILGFDITNPTSILISGALFHALETKDIIENAQTDISAPTPTETPNQSPEKNIENVHISKGMTISNATSYDVNAETLSAEPPDFALDNNGVQVLIVHTHTTESYTAEGKNTYTENDSDRSTDDTKNIVVVGNKICEVLNNAGIKTIHDTTVHDYPSYNGAYGRALATIKKNIEQNPSIKVVLDVHRDGLIRADGTKLKVTADINGVQTAQVMLVVGTNATGLQHDNWQSNMKFASKIQKKAIELYPDLMRPINLREERFNQHMTGGSLILEVGSNGNTLDEAVCGGEYIANVISEVLKNG